MSTTPIRNAGWKTGLLILVTAVGIGARVTMTASADSSQGTKLNQLLHEKLKILQHVVTLREEMRKNDMSGPKELYDAHVALQRAKLELCVDDRERLQVLEDLLSEAQRRETQELDLLKRTNRDPLNGPMALIAEGARIDRLNIEIEIERLKLK